MCNDVVLGIDTSNYTTSVSVMSLSGELLLNLKKLLCVKPGERGLRQSDALFAHTVNLPELFDTARAVLDGKRIVAVGVSDKPRSVDGSYMPCFLAGVSAASAASSALNVPLYRFSHQSGHVMAALYSSGNLSLIGREFAAFHVSGGTTEILRATPEADPFKLECVGGAEDLNAGQIIDRVGVYLGLGFPAGPELEALALINTKKIPKRKLSVKGMAANLSGLENIAKKMYDETADKALVSAVVLDFIGRTLDELSNAYTERYGQSHFVYAGGVMCNSIIKNMLSQGRAASFAEPQMSSDNAVGIAALALRRYSLEK